MNEINVWQSWDNVLDAIKTELGHPAAQIEVTDQEILEKLYKHVLPQFSTHSGLTKYYKVTYDNLISESPVLRYKIKDFDYRILGINGKIDKSTYIDMQMSQLQHMSGDITNFLVRQNYLDMSNMVRADNTYKFKAPDIVEVIKAGLSYIGDEFILDLNCVHEDPTTIDSTLYEEFLNLCIAYCLNWIGKIRKKYSSINTPFGQIEMNADDMINEARELKRDTLDKLMRTPQDQLVWIL